MGQGYFIHNFLVEIAPEQRGQPVCQWLQGHADAPDPLCQRGSGQWHALAGGDLLDPVKGQVVEVFAGRHPRQQANGGQAAVDHRRRDMRCRHRLAGAARVLRTNVAMHEEACRFHVQLLTDVFADLDQVGAALAALTGFWLMAVLDARQFRWQRLTAGSLAQSLGRRLGVKFLLDRGQVGVDRFLKQQALFATERFTGLAEAYPAVVGQFVRQRLDLEILLGQQGILPRQLGLLMPELGLLLLQLSLLLRILAKR
jgi:hypothetical protein